MRCQVEKEGRGYVFARNGVMLRDAVAALQDFTKLVREESVKALAGTIAVSS